MRPIRITGITGDSPWVPLDTYSPAQANASVDGVGVLEITLDNPFDESITPEPIALPTQAETLPPGARAVRATGMVPADILRVSQQGIA